jgi:hypothetical protein
MGEIFLPFRTPKPRTVSEARSTLIIAGIQTLRAQGHYDRYIELLPPNARQEIISLVAGIWIPGELALGHYRNMDRLALPTSMIEAIGAEVAQRGARTVLKRAATTPTDRTPWRMLELLQRNLDTNWRGSDMMVSKEGPQRAIVTWAGQPCASVPYFVTSWGGLMRAATNLYCTSAQHRVLQRQSSPTTIAIELSWV